MQIQISWCLQKPTDLNLHCLLRQDMSCSAREGLTFISAMMSVVTFYNEQWFCKRTPKTLIKQHKCTGWSQYYENIPPWTPLLYSKTGVYRGIHNFSYFCSKTDCGYSLELPWLGSSNKNPQPMFWAEIWKISEFLSENFQFLVVKFSIYLNRWWKDIYLFR